MTTTLNHYNKKNKRRTKTQRKNRNKKNHGGRRSYNDFGPGNVYYFDESNLNDLDHLMQQIKQRRVPTIFRHTDDRCPYCKDFNKPWKEFEEITEYPSQSHSVASVYPKATDHILNNYPDYPRVNGVPAVILVNKDGVPIEHTGPLDALQKFLDDNGLKIVTKDQARDKHDDAPVDADAHADDFGAGGVGAGLGAAGLGGLGAGLEPEPESESVAPFAPELPESQEPVAPFTESVAPFAPESAETTLSTVDKVKETVSKIDNKIKDGISVLTQPIDFKEMLGIKSDSAQTQDANAQAQDANAQANADAQAEAQANQAADAFPPAPEPVQDQDQMQAPAQAPEQQQQDQTKAPQLPSNGGRRSNKGKKSVRRRKSKSASRTKRRHRHHRK